MSTSTREWFAAGADGYAPAAAAAHAVRWLDAFEKAVKRRGLVWVEPHLGVDSFNDVSCEWWARRPSSRKLSLYFDGSTVVFFKMNGPDPMADIEDGDAGSSDDACELWEWLYGSDEPVGRRG